MAEKRSYAPSLPPQRRLRYILRREAATFGRKEREKGKRVFSLSVFLGDSFVCSERVRRERNLYSWESPISGRRVGSAPLPLSPASLLARHVGL